MTTDHSDAPSLREKKKTQARARILSAANRLIRSRGYDETTMREIAAAAEVSYQTLYNYYPTKGEILFQLLMAQVDDLSDQYAGLLQSYEGGLLDTLEQLSRLALESLTGDDQALWRIAMAEFLNQGRGAEEMLAPIETAVHRTLEDLLRAARDTGELLPATPITALAGVLFDLMDYAAVRLLFDTKGNSADRIAMLGTRLRVVVSPYLLPDMNTP